MTKFDKYLEKIPRYDSMRHEQNRPSSEVWRAIVDWYTSEAGRELFIKTFTAEPKIKLNPKRDSDSHIQMAISNSLGDYRKKRKCIAYYNAHAEMYLKEMDRIIERTSGCFVEVNSDRHSMFGDLMNFVEKLLNDHRCLITDYETNVAKTPMNIGSYRNPLTSALDFFQCANQLIYGCIPGLSTPGNHCDLAVAIIRQAVEVRLRNAFGIIGKERLSDDTFHPVPLSDLLDVLKDHNDAISMTVPIRNLDRIYRWANLYLHSGLRMDYSWTASRVVDYLSVFLTGHEHPVFDERSEPVLSRDSGIQLEWSVFLAIRSALKEKIENPEDDEPKFKSVLMDEKNCDVVLSPENYGSAGQA